MEVDYKDIGEYDDYIMSNNIDLLAERIYNDNKAKGFWDDKRSTAECIALMHSELSEALEADRKKLQSDHLPAYTGVEEELADTLIRILDYAGAHHLRLGDAVFAKLEYNRGRPHKHGKEY